MTRAETFSTQTQYSSASARSYNSGKLFRSLAIHLILILGAVLFLGPFVWLVSTSLKTYNALFDYPPTLFPQPIQWSNYPDALTALPFGRYLLNTLIISVTAVVGHVMAASLVAFSFARLRWPGRDRLFLVVLVTMMLPTQVTFIPQFIGYRELGMINTFWPLILPAYLGGGPFNIFLLRQFFMGLPRELDDAARIDGCSNFGVYLRIILPNSVPALMTVALFAFFFHWNDFFGPLIYLQDPDLRTISLGLRQFVSDYRTDWQLVMAASTAALMPLIIIYFLAQRYFVQGVVFTGVKS